jgi:serine phosphatase RsbU (regulator of sigma subunit)
MAETRRQNELMRQELEMAARYQQFLLPRQVDVQSAQVAYLFQPCRGVGGDYFDFLVLPGGQEAFVMADVAGHGVASAMTASIVKAIWPGLLAKSSSPAEAFRQLNADLLRLTQEDVFVTAFGAVFDPATRSLTWSLAGHPSPLFLPAGQAPVDLNMRSVFLGIFENDNPLVQFADEGLTVRPGDRLFLYTDGLTEAPGEKGGMYGLDRLRSLMAAHRSENVNSLREIIWEDLNAFTQGEFPDDVAFIIVEF